MDTSEAYIKMCDCLEIQEEQSCRKKDGSFYYTKTYKKVMVDSFTGGNSSIWLPRQDQIQEMLNYGIGALVNEFEGFCNDDLKMYDSPDDFPKTMEQLWLMFYMKEKHKKVWDKDKWVKVEEQNGT